VRCVRSRARILPSQPRGSAPDRSALDTDTRAASGERPRDPARRRAAGSAPQGPRARGSTWVRVGPSSQLPRAFRVPADRTGSRPPGEISRTTMVAVATVLARTDPRDDYWARAATCRREGGFRCGGRSTTGPTGGSRRPPGREKTTSAAKASPMRPPRSGRPHEGDPRTFDRRTPEPASPVDEPTLELRTLHTTVPLRRPTAFPAGSPAHEARICRTVLLRLPRGGPASPCHPNALRAMPNPRTRSARPSSAHATTTRRRRALAVVIVVLVLLLPLALCAVLRGHVASSTPEAVSPAPRAIRLPLAPSSAPSPEGSTFGPGLVRGPRRTDLETPH
jgi:hypothetical protein